MQVKTILRLIDEEKLPEELTPEQWEGLKQQSAAGMSIMLRALVQSVKESLTAKVNSFLPTKGLEKRPKKKEKLEDEPT